MHQNDMRSSVACMDLPVPVNNNFENDIKEHSNSVYRVPIHIPICENPMTEEPSLLPAINTTTLNRFESCYDLNDDDCPLIEVDPAVPLIEPSSKGFYSYDCDSSVKSFFICIFVTLLAAPLVYIGAVAFLYKHV